MLTRRLGIASVTPTPTARTFLALGCLLLPIRGSSGVEAFPSPRQNAQPRPPVFRVEVNYVELAASVVDPNGRFVEGLAVEDFELYEDGERQEMFKSTEPREVRPGTRVVSYEGSIPLDGLREGPYLLTVAARLLGREDTAERTIPFWIE